jgi:hypothetical protein
LYFFSIYELYDSAATGTDSRCEFVMSCTVQIKHYARIVAHVFGISSTFYRYNCHEI